MEVNHLPSVRQARGSRSVELIVSNALIKRQTVRELHLLHHLYGVGSVLRLFKLVQLIHLMEVYHLKILVTRLLVNSLVILCNHVLFVINRIPLLVLFVMVRLVVKIQILNIGLVQLELLIELTGRLSGWLVSTLRPHHLSAASIILSHVVP